MISGGRAEAESGFKLDAFAGMEGVHKLAERDHGEDLMGLCVFGISVFRH